MQKKDVPSSRRGQVKKLLFSRRSHFVLLPLPPPPQLIGLGHPVMCGASTATIPPGPRLSTYRSLAGVYYAEGRCQEEGRGRGGGGEGWGCVGERRREDWVEEMS